MKRVVNPMAAVMCLRFKSETFARRSNHPYNSIISFESYFELPIICAYAKIIGSGEQCSACRIRLHWRLATKLYSCKRAVSKRSHAA